MDSRTRFGWNVAYNYIMGIKDAYTPCVSIVVSET